VVNGVNTIDCMAGLRRGIQGGEVNALTGHLKARSYWA
jgi:hypothetical protein